MSRLLENNGFEMISLGYKFSTVDVLRLDNEFNSSESVITSFVLNKIYSNSLFLE